MIDAGGAWVCHNSAAHCERSARVQGYPLYSTVIWRIVGG